MQKKQKKISNKKLKPKVKPEQLVPAILFPSEAGTALQGELLTAGGENKLRSTQKFKEDLEKNPPSAPAPDVIERYIRRTDTKPIYKSPDEMQDIIIDYFKANMVEVFDEQGEFRGYQWCNRISVGGLSIHLGLSTQTLWDYSKRDAYSETIKRAKNIIEAYYETALQENRNPAGLCFILKNGFGWRDVQEIKVEPVNPLGEVISQSEIIEQVKSLPGGNYGEG